MQLITLDPYMLANPAAPDRDDCDLAVGNEPTQGGEADAELLRCVW
jgi:hypothetical protein